MNDETFQSTPKKQRQMVYLLLVLIIILALGCGKDKLPDRPAQTEYVKIEANNEYVAVYDSNLKMAGSGEYSVLVNGKEEMSGIFGGDFIYTDYIIFKGDKYKVVTGEYSEIYRIERE